MIAPSPMALSFVHPMLAWVGLGAGLIPVLVHLLNRRRYTRLRWAAMSFLMTATRRSARRMRLEHWLLLLTRMSLIILLGLAIARPYARSMGVLPLSGSGVHRVLLIDNSYSMSALVREGVTRFDLARTCAKRLLDSFGPRDGVSLLTLASPAEAVVAQAAFDRRYLRERLASLPSTRRATDAAGALSLATELLRNSSFPKENRAVYLISDLPPDDWSVTAKGAGTADVAAARRLADQLPRSAADFTVVRVSEAIDHNVAVTALRSEAPFGGVNVPIRIEVEIANLGRTSARGLTLQLRRDGQLARRQTLPALAPGGGATATFTTEFRVPGTHVIQAKIVDVEDEALTLDNSRFQSIEIRKTTPVLLIDGQLGADRLSGQAGFLATALAPNVQGSRFSPLEPKIITEPELMGEPLLPYAVVALCDVHRLSKRSWERLAAFVSGGGGLMIFAGDLVDTEHYNRFGYADGKGVMPGTFADHPRSYREGGGDLGYKLTEPVHPLLADFSDQRESGLFTARVNTYLPFTWDKEKGEVVLKYTNDDPAIVASKLGQGRVLVFTTSPDMAWTNLPAKGDFVSLMLSATAHLSRRVGMHRNLMVGDTLRERLTPEQHSSPLRVSFGEGGSAEPAVVPSGDALTATFGPVEEAGIVTLKIGPETRVFAVNVDPVESDLRSMDRESFRQSLQRPIRWIDDPSAGLEKPISAASTELGPFALYGVLGLLLVEMWLAVWFGARRGHVTRSRHLSRIPGRGVAS